MSLRSRLLTVVSVLVIAAVCARLGIWQVNRLEQRRSANAAALAARSAPPLVLQGGSQATVTMANRRVEATGHYDRGHDIVLRGRQYRGVPGVEIVSPLLLEGGRTAVLVNRGFVPSPDAVSIDPDTLWDAGEVTVQGIALAIDSTGGARLQRGRETSWARLDRTALRTALPYPIHPVYIRQSPDTTRRRFPRPLDPPPLDDGPHLSYAIQWFSFAVLALVFGVVILKQSVNSKR
jgi:surfeit locus 1 family protein